MQLTCGETILTALRLGLWGCMLLATLAVRPVFAQSDGDVVELGKRADELYEAGRFGEAAPLAERALALAEQRFAADQPEVAKALYDLARIQQRLGQYQEAEPRLLRALAIRERAAGPRARRRWTHTQSPR